MQGNQRSEITPYWPSDINHILDLVDFIVSRNNAANFIKAVDIEKLISDICPILLRMIENIIKHTY